MVVAAVLVVLPGCGAKRFERKVISPEIGSMEIIKVIYGSVAYCDSTDNAFLTIEGTLRVEQVSEVDYEVYILTGTNFDLDGSTKEIYNVVYIHTNPGDFFCITAPYQNVYWNSNVYYWRIQKEWYVSNVRM